MFLVEKDSKKFLHVKITIKNEHEASQSVKLNAKFLSSLTWVQVMFISTINFYTILEHK